MLAFLRFLPCVVVRASWRCIYSLMRSSLVCTPFTIPQAMNSLIFLRPGLTMISSPDFLTGYSTIPESTFKNALKARAMPSVDSISVRSGLISITMISSSALSISAFMRNNASSSCLIVSFLRVNFSSSSITHSTNILTTTSRSMPYEAKSSPLSKGLECP